jgi:hypothetical protein
LTFAGFFQIMGLMSTLSCLRSHGGAAAASALLALAAAACCSQKNAQCPDKAAPPAGTAALDEEKCLQILDVDPQVTLRGAVKKAIGFLNEKNYQAIFEEIAYPQDVEDLKEDGHSLDEIIEAFASKRADILLMALESIADAEPKLSEDGLTATFTLSGQPAELSPSKTITMVRLEGKWYLKN